MQTRLRVLGYGVALLLAALASGPAPAQEDLLRAAREATDRARTKVVVLKTSHGERTGSATGFLARPRLVVTAAHAVDQAQRVTAWLNGVSYPAELLSIHPEYDLALLALKAPELLLKPADLASTAADLRPGESLLILAGPSQTPRAHGEPRDRVAILGTYRRRLLARLANGKSAMMLALDATVRLGDSGSPVLRVRDGRVVGVLCSREIADANGVSRQAFVAPVEALHGWLEDEAARFEGRDVFYLQRVTGTP